MHKAAEKAARDNALGALGFNTMEATVGAEEALRRFIADREAEARRWEELCLAEIRRREEAQRIAQEKEQHQRELKHRWQRFQDVRGGLAGLIERGNEPLQVIYRAAAAGDPVQPQVELLHAIVAPALAYPATATELQTKRRFRWGRAPPAPSPGIWISPTKTQGSSLRHCEADSGGTPPRTGGQGFG